jgi:DNA-binding phage protein
MSDERGKRVFRPATDQERKRHADVRLKVESEIPEIRKRANERLELIKKDGTPLRQLLGALQAERKRQGLSLADIHERTGIDRAALSRLENNEEANPTLTTLERYASAVGKHMIVFLTEAST